MTRAQGVEVQTPAYGHVEENEGEKITGLTFVMNILLVIHRWF